MAGNRKRRAGPAVNVGNAPTSLADEGLVRTAAGTLFNAKPWKGRSRGRGRPVDVLYAMSVALKNTPHIQVIADRLRLETDPHVFAEPFAEAVAEQIDANIRAGKNPSGRPSKPLTAAYAKRRGSSGPRGLRTGKTLSTLRVVSGQTLVGSFLGTVKVQMDQPYSKGQFSHSFAGARFTYNPNDPIIKAALEEIADLILAPDDGADNG